ncbi:hypothetical protein INR49_032108 [Caranx melampygus]|nr:hypothetical protein INR49_032108 [Caranx melampygus]
MAQVTFNYTTKYGRFLSGELIKVLSHLEQCQNFDPVSHCNALTPSGFILNEFSFISSLVRPSIMNRAWAVFKAHPYISNVLGYTALFASADVIQQSVLGGKRATGATSDAPAGIDWCQTARVATVGLSLLESKEDPLEDWKQKFWTSYKAGVVFWSTMQAVNFALVPPVARTVFLGGIALTFTVFLCHLRQQHNHKLE